MSESEIVYLDNNATTRVDPAVLEEMLPFLTESYGNPSSGYRFGMQVRRTIDLARERLAGLLGCQPREIVFTSGGTEADNAAINSALQFEPRGKHVVTTAVEHSAVRRHCQELAKRGCEVTFLEVDQEGRLDPDRLEAVIRPETAIVSIMWANNETGVLFPIPEIAAICRTKNVLFHTDAVQAIGKIPIRLRDLGLHFLSLSAHKFYGPKGVGALYVNSNTPFAASIIGGGQESARRAGTENVASIVGLGKAAERASQSLEKEETRVRPMRDRFEAALAEKLPGIRINGRGAPRLPNTSNLSFAGIDSSSALVLLDQQGICCSAGSACRTGSAEASHVLAAMGLAEPYARGSLRFSFGRFNSDVDLKRAMAAVPQIIQKLRRLSPVSV
jgi:cysteine desulfurase